MQHGQDAGSFRCRLKNSFGIAAGKGLVPVRDVGRRIGFRHGQPEMRACQHGKHFRPHLLEGIALERLRLFLLTVLPAFVAGCMKELMQFGGIVFIRAAESVRIGQRHFVFLVAEKGIAAVMFDDNAGTGADGLDNDIFS